MNSFDKILTSRSPEELPELTLCAPSKRSSERIERLVLRGIGRKTRQNNVRYPVRAIALAACLVMLCVVTVTRFTDIQRGISSALSALLGGETTAETTETPIVSNDIALVSLDVTEKGANAVIDFTLDCSAKLDSGIVLYSAIELWQDGELLESQLGHTREQSYNAILAGDVLSCEGGRLELSISTDAAKLGLGEITLKIGSLWTADFAGEQGEELVLGDDFASELEFTVPLEAHAGGISLESVSLETVGLNTRLSFTLDCSKQFTSGDVLYGPVELWQNGERIVAPRSLGSDVYDRLECVDGRITLTVEAPTARLTSGEVVLKLSSLQAAAQSGEELVLGESFAENLEFTVPIELPRLTDGEITVESVEIETKGLNAILNFTLDVGELCEYRFVLYDRLELEQNGQSLAIRSGTTRERSYYAILAGDIFECVDGRLSISIPVAAQSLRDGNVTLKLDRLWSADLAGEMGDELVISENFAEELEFVVPIDLPYDSLSELIASMPLFANTPRGEVTAEIVEIGETSVVLKLCCPEPEGEYLLATMIQLTQGTSAVAAYYGGFDSLRTITEVGDLLATRDGYEDGGYLIKLPLATSKLDPEILLLTVYGLRTADITGSGEDIGVVEYEIIDELCIGVTQP